MMKHCGFHNGDGQSPKSKQVAAGFGMSCAEDGSFSFDQRNGIFMGARDSLRILFGKIGDQYEASDIMEQTGGERLFDDFLVLTLELGDAFGRSRGGEA